MKHEEIIEMLSPYEQVIAKREIEQLPDKHYRDVDASYREMLTNAHEYNSDEHVMNKRR